MPRKKGPWDNVVSLGGGGRQEGKGVTDVFVGGLDEVLDGALETLGEGDLGVWVGVLQGGVECWDDSSVYLIW